VRTARLRWAALVAAAVLAVAGPAPRARAQSTGTTAGALLTIPATARSLGLGGAYTAVVGDEGNIFVNPAGLAAISHAALGVSYEKYLFDSYLVSAGVDKNRLTTQGFGASKPVSSNDTALGRSQNRRVEIVKK